MDKHSLRDASLPQPLQSDSRGKQFWDGINSQLSSPPATAAPKRDLDTEWSDYPKAVGAGALELVGGIGELARQASNFGKENAGKQGGDYLEQARANMANKLSPLLDVVAGAGDLAASGAESLNDGMSADAKEALGRRLVDETPEGRLTLGDGAGDIDVWAMKMAQGVGSLLPTLAAGGVTGVAAKASIGRAVTASMVKRGATQEVAEAVAAKAVSKIATGAAVTTGATGSVGSAGVNTRDTVLGMSFDELAGSDTFRQSFTRIDQDQQTAHLSDEEKLGLAREETANLASRATMSDAKVWGAAAMGSMMGDAMLFKMLAGKAATGGVLKGAAKGAAGEGISETLEEGVQQYAVNESLNEVAAADIDPMKGVMSSAIEGGLIGMGTGGAVGAVGGARGGKHASQEDGVGTDPVAEPSAPVTEGAAGPAVDPNFASIPLEDGEQAPSASQAEGELNPLGPSASQFDELRDVPAYLRRDDTAARFKGMAADSEVQRALAGEFGQSVQELVASQMQAGDQGKSLYERAQAGELGLDPFAGNKSAQQVAMENQRLALPLKDVIFAGDANAKPKGEAVAAPGDHDDQQAGPGPQFRGGERTRWQSGQEGDVLPPEASSTKPAGELPGAVIEGEAREVGNELPHRNVVYGNDLRAEQQRAADLARRERELNNQPLQIGQSETLFAGGTPGADPRNSAYTPPRLSRDQVDTSMDEQSTRDPRSPVAQSIEQAGSATDSVFGPLKSLRITRKGKPFATEKEAVMASRRGQEMPVPLNGGGFGVAAIGEVQQAQAQQGAVKQPSSNSAQQDRQDGKTEIAQNGMVIVHGSGNPGMSEQDIQIVRASGQKQGKKGRVYGGFYGTSEQDAHQAQAYADMMGGTPTLYDVKIKPGTKVLHKQGDITRLSESYINELVSQGYGVVTGTDPRGQTEHVVIDKSAVASMAPRGAQATPSQVDDINVADMRQPSDQPAKNVSAETVPAPSATAGEASQLVPAIDTGYREVIPGNQPQVEVSNEPVTPVPAIGSERQGDQPGAGEPAAAGIGTASAGLTKRTGTGDPTGLPPALPAPDGQQQNDPTLTAPATDAGASVSGVAQPEPVAPEPAAAPTPWAEAIDNPDGTITLKGEVPAIKQWAKESGVKAIPGKGGLVVAKSFTAKVRGLTAPAANEPSALVEAARGGVVPEPTEVDLIDRDLLKEHAGRWKYRSAVGAGWFTANTKEAAIERAEEAYRKAVSKGEPVPTRDERFAQADAELFSEMDRRYGKMSTPELEAEYQRLGGEVGDLQKSGSGEFNGNGGRRTGAAVSNEGARQVGEERLRLGVYMKMRRDRDTAGSGAKSQQIEPANDWRGGDLFGLAGARNNHGAAPSVPRSGDASAAKGAGGVTEGRLELDGVSIRIPAIDEEQQRLYNQATHRGQGVNFASGISTGVGRILNDLKDAGLLDTAEQRAAAEAEVQAWANEEAINARKLMRDGIKTPSWVITGRSGRKAQSSAATERENNRQTQHYKDQDARIKALRDELKKLRPKEVIGRESFNYAWGKAKGMIAEYASALSGGQPNLLASLRKSMNSELSRYLQAMEKIDAQGFIKTLSEQDNRLKAAGYDGLVAIVGARSNPGKIISDAINGRIRFSKQAMAQGEKPAKHLTRKEAELVTKEWFKQYRGASGIDVQIHATQAELEKALGLAAQDGLIRRAAFDDDSGTLHVAADTIANPKRMREILRHEVLAHYGLANVLGDGEYTKLMSRLIQSQKDPSMKPVWDWVNTHYADEDIGTQAEEVVAHLAEVEQGAWGRGWDRVVAWVTRALRAVGFVPDGITAAETRSLIEGLGKKLKRSGPDDNGPDGDKKFSQEVDLPTEISQDSVGKTLDVSGVERPTINHDGQPIHQTEEGLRNFWRWFGNSLMRDGAGNPVVVYHATESDITAFNTRDAVENQSFYYGEDNGREKDAGGFFFTPDKTLANDYAENRPNANIIPVYLKLNNPVYLDEMSLEEQGNYLREARANGHDGAIIGDGLEYVVFTPEQIKSAIGNNGEYSKSNPDVRFSQTNTAADDSKTLEQSIKQKAVYQAGAALSSVKNWLKQGRPLMLGTLTDLQIDQVYRDITGGAVSQYQRLRTQMEADRNDILLDAETRIDPLWDALGKQEKADLSNLMHDATMARLHPDKSLDENSYYLEAKQKVERAKKPETKAAYEAELHIIERNHSELARQYNALPANAKALYDTMQDTYTKQWESLRGAIEQRLEDLLGVNQGRAMAAEMRQKMEHALQHGPYFPLTRYGDYVVKARKGDEYVREHFERRADAEQAVKQYQRDGYNAVMTVKEEGGGDSANANQLGMEMLSFLDSADGVSKSALKDEIWQAMLRMMPDASYAKHAIHRRRVKGASRDAHRAYLNSVYHYARHVSKIRYGHKMLGELDKLSEQIRAGVAGEPSSLKPEDLEIAQQVLNEMNKRHDLNMNPTGKAWAGSAGNIGFLYYIGPSVASAVVNMTQNFTVMLPQLGAKYGFAKSAAAMTQALGDYVKHGKFKAGTTEAWHSLTRSTTLPADERAILDRLYRAGALDLTQAHSIAAKADTDQQDAKPMGKRWRRAMRWAGATFHNAEVLNREVAALAAYRLLKQAEPTLNGQQYADRVAEMVYDGHGNYAASNRPRYMRNDITKVLTQFKIYSQMMTYVLYSNAIKAAKGDKVAQKTLAGVLATHWVMAGVMGLPTPITAVVYAIAAGLDDDDDRSGEASFRLALTEALGPRAGELLAKGPMDALTNLSIAGRTGLGDLWWRSPKEGTEGDDLAWHAVQQLLGPVAGIGINLARGAGQMTDGHIQRGLETMLPKSIRDVAKSYRQATEGEQTIKGDIIMDDVSTWNVAMQGLGFGSAQMAKNYDAREYIKGKEKRIADKRSQLLTDYYMARKSGEMDEVQEVLERIKMFNSINHPRERITGKSLALSFKSKLRSNERTQGGVYLNRNREYLREEGRFAD
ncbi:PLxRFG domain-containing protein [Aeromonas caviae]|uniref:PLxRFG domain-containing protein n=1 Tax=Aeromonas caviae TaxID=648 RepID=UPI0038CF712F